MTMRLMRDAGAALMLVVFGFVSTANATLIDAGDYATDTNTDLRWLKLNILNGYSYQSVQSGALGYTTSGWRFATGPELANLFGQYVGPMNGQYVRPDSGISPTYFDGANELVVALGMNLAFGDSRAAFNITSQIGLHQISIQGFYDDGSPGFPIGIAEATAVISDAGGIYGQNEFETVPFGRWVLSPDFWSVPTQFGPYMSSYLVQKSPLLNRVPEPSTIALIGMALLSLFGFGLMRRRAWVPAMLVVGSSLGFASSASASLLTPAYEAQLSTWLGQGSLTFTNIYSAGTSDGNFNSFDWHSAVDGKGATFTLMEVPAGTYRTYDANFGELYVTIDGAVIGGYNPQSWSTSGWNYTPTDTERTAFIYNLSTSILLRQILSTDPDTYGTGHRQTYNDVNYGPTFGMGPDFFTYGDFSNFAVNPYSYGATYGSGLFGTTGGGIFTGYILDLSAVTLETYTFSATDEVPEPSTIALIGMALLSLFGFGMMRHRQAQ